MRRIIVLPFAVLLAAWTLLPIYWILNLSLQPRFDSYTVPAYLIPRHPTLVSYLTALGFMKGDVPGIGGGGLLMVPLFQEGLKNSLILATTVMILTVAICLPAGYSFARFGFPLRTGIFAIIMLARSFPPISSVIPYYQFYKAVGLLGTFQGMVLVDLTLTIPLTTWVLAGFFSTLPVELEKQARIDGCSRLQMLKRIVLPIAAPGLAAVAILAWLDSWNEFIYAFLLADVKGLRFVSVQAASPLVERVSLDPAIFATFVAISVIPPVVAAICLVPYMTRLRIGDPLTFRTP